MGAREEVEVLVAAEQLGAAELAQLLCRESEPSTLHFFQFLVAQSKSRMEAINEERKSVCVYRRWCNGKARQGKGQERKEDEKGLKKEEQEGGTMYVMITCTMSSA